MNGKMNGKAFGGVRNKKSSRILESFLGGAPRNRFHLTSYVKSLMGAITRDQLFDLSAQLAFWSILALFPFVGFLLTVVGFIPLGGPSGGPLGGLDQQITESIYRAMPHDAAVLFDHTVHEVIGRQRGILLVIALAGSVWTASGAMNSSITALNRAYNVAETRPWWLLRLLSIGVTIGAALMILLATVGLIIGPSLGAQIFERVGLGAQWSFVWGLVRWPLVLALMSIAMSGIYYFLPNVRQKFRFISPGSVAAIAFWLIATLVFNAYVARFGSYTKTYGTLGAAISLFMWIYLSCAAMLFGGEMNSVLDQTLLGISHRERQKGLITRPDRGRSKGELTTEVKADENDRQMVA